MPATFSVGESLFDLNTPLYGVSDDAKELRLASSGELLETSITLGRRQVDVFLRLLEACSEAAEDQEAEKPLAATFENAERFGKVIPPRIPLPSVMIHPDGEVAFEWHIARDRVLTVSLGAEQLASFAAIVDGATVYGREPFTGFLPNEVTHLLDRLFPPSAFTIRR